MVRLLVTASAVFAAGVAADREAILDRTADGGVTPPDGSRVEIGVIDWACDRAAGALAAAFPAGLAGSGCGGTGRGGMA